MPKRQNPFDDVAPLQYKTHVRCKEVELGDKTKMRAVFGTWNFLFIISSIVAFLYSVSFLNTLL